MKCTLKYLEACNKVFENGLLSHERVTNLESEVLKVYNGGIQFFCKWHQSLLKPGTVTDAAIFITIIVVHMYILWCVHVHTQLHLFHSDKPMETSKFLAWQSLSV